MNEIQTLKARILDLRIVAVAYPGASHIKARINGLARDLFALTGEVLVNGSFVKAQ